MTERTATITRDTLETQTTVSINLDGTGKARFKTDVPFLEHMMQQIALHGMIDIDIEANGDIQIDDHHTVEDIGIVLGEALGKVIYPAKEIERFGNAVVVMDDASISCDIDLSNRAYFVYDLPLDEGTINGFDLELVEEFFKSVTFNMPLNMHLIYNRGKNKHHIAEAAFKAFGVSLRRAVNKNDRIGVPSTKGVL